MLKYSPVLDRMSGVICACERIISHVPAQLSVSKSVDLFRGQEFSLSEACFLSRMDVQPLQLHMFIEYVCRFHDNKDFDMIAKDGGPPRVLYSNLYSVSSSRSIKFGVKSIPPT